MRHLYVLVPLRRSGIGEQLVADVVEAARGRFERPAHHERHRGAALRAIRVSPGGRRA
jgi:hypothetical protein